jgi:hypothetical protein
VPNVEDKFPWIELAALLPDGHMVRGDFARINAPQTMAAWRQRHANRDIYTSICRFAGPTWDSRYICPAYFDIDSKGDPERAGDQTLKLCDMIWKRLHIPPEMISIFFSGCKGFHVEIPPATFGQNDDQRDITVWRYLAHHLRATFPCIDTVVYHKKALWRLVNSINSKSGLFKIAVDYKELRDFGIKHVLELAVRPRDEERMGLTEEVPEALAWHAEALTWISRRSATPRRNIRSVIQGVGWRVPPCMRRIELEVTLPDGVRHDIYFTITRLWASIGMASDEALARLQAIDRRNPIHDSAAYFEHLRRDAGKYPAFSRCPNPNLKPYCSPDKCFFCQQSDTRRLPSGGISRDVPKEDHHAGSE